MEIVAFSGPKFSGKNTAAGILQRFVEPGIWSKQLGFADPIKDLASHLYDWSPRIIEEYKEVPDARYDGLTPRKACQVIGTEIGRLLYKDTWVDYLFRQADRSKTNLLLITDLRFPNELDAIKRKGGLVVYIERPIELVIETLESRRWSQEAIEQATKKDSHESESYFRTIKSQADFCYINDGSELSLAEDLAYDFDSYSWFDRDRVWATFEALNSWESLETDD